LFWLSYDIWYGSEVLSLYAILPDKLKTNDVIFIYYFCVARNGWRGVNRTPTQTLYSFKVMV